MGGESTRFKPGQSGNPAGKKPDPPGLKALKKLTKAELEALICEMLLSNPADFAEKYSAKKATTVLELWLASGANKAIKDGDYSRLMTLIDRLHGKPQTKIELTKPDDVIDVTQSTLNEQARQLQRAIEQYQSQPSEPVTIESLQPKPDIVIERTVDGLETVPVDTTAVK